MITVFVSHNYKDSQYFKDIDSISKNTNNPLSFDNCSLFEPVHNPHGDVIRSPPSDPQASDVKKEINRMLDDADKLLILIGNDTHSKEWVTWEINSFVSRNGWGNVLLMSTPDNARGGAPEIANHLPLHSWDISYLATWVKDDD